ncbi:MAG: feruloyl esterase [Solirubrobacterales bacterium]|nr:feruloyl esterase [Solirubrobacterales bacterium]
MMRYLAGFAASGSVLLAGAAFAAPAPGPASALTPQEAAACAALTGATLPGGTTITEAAAVPAGALRLTDRITATNLPAFCRVQGVSRPTPDSNIHFEVWLPGPAGWNGKFLSAGEGGYAGQVRYGGSSADGALDSNLRRGYATASTDTGHETAEPHFAIGHPERGIDYLIRAKHVTTVAAKAIIARFYGRAPIRSYFSSCSNGGREGLLEAQLYPDDFDGIIVGAPWNLQSRSTIAHLWMRKLLNAPGAAIPAEKLLMVHTAVLKACDASDGLADGVINDPLSCRFEPKTLQCKAGDALNCLTALQVASLTKIYRGPRDPRDGSSLFPGFAMGRETNTFGRPDSVGGMPEGFVTNFVHQDANWDWRTFDPEKDRAPTLAAGRIGDAGSTDFEAAKRRGVKIIQYHGWNDPGIPPGNSVRYYDQVTKTNGGLAKTQGFYRLFMVPGMGHCAGDVGASNFGGAGQHPPPVRDGDHDLVTALENWVERGTAPGEFIATKYAGAEGVAGAVKFQRRLCLYPAVAKYKGAGDPNEAANFACAVAAPRVSP